MAYNDFERIQTDYQMLISSMNSNYVSNLYKGFMLHQSRVENSIKLYR